jgi:hypothetical protein
VATLGIVMLISFGFLSSSLSSFFESDIWKKLMAPPDAHQQRIIASKTPTLRLSIIEMIKNTNGCDAIDASALVEAYIKKGDEISNTRRVLILEGFKITDNEHMEAEYWFKPVELERKFELFRFTQVGFLPTTAIARIKVDHDNETAAAKDRVVVSSAAIIYPCASIQREGGQRK